MKTTLNRLAIIAATATLAACGSGSEPTEPTLSVKSAFDVTNPLDATQVYKFYSDTAEGAMIGPSNYGALAYGVDDSHNMWPNFTTYLFKDGDRYFKAQIISNYGSDGALASGNLYVRYAEVDSVSGGTTAYADMDATAGAVHLDLEAGTLVNSDQAWQFSYQKYVGYKVNGGISGSGDVTACIAHTPSGLYDEEGKAIEAGFKNLTFTNTLTDFEAVNAASCEPDSFIADALNTQIKMEDWVTADYSQGAPIYSASTELSNGWLVQSATVDANENAQYGRVKVSSVDYQAGVKRALNFSVEAWDDNSQTFLIEDISPEINFTNDRQYWDMETNSVVSAEDDWELSVKVEGYSWVIQVNAGVSGSGNAGIAYVLLTEENVN